MAVRTASKGTQKAAGKTKTATKAGKRQPAKGESMVCEVCGLSVIVEQVGDIAVAREDVLLCCGEPMKSKAAKPKKTKK